MSGETELCRVRGGTFRRLFPSSPWKGRRLARRLIASAVSRYARSCVDKGFRVWHGLRHTALTETAVAGVPAMFGVAFSRCRGTGRGQGVRRSPVP